jgi:hypothetical protein
MPLGWDDIGDLMQYQTKNDIQTKLLSTYRSDTNRNNDAIANFEFANSINIGDIIIVKKGRYELLGFVKLCLITILMIMKMIINIVEGAMEIKWKLER